MITWKSLTADQLKALQAVEDNEMSVNCRMWQDLQSMGLVAYDEGSDADYLTPLGESVYNAYRAAQQPEADRGEGERKPILSRLLPNHINLLRGIVRDGCIELFTDASYALMDAGWLEHNNVVSRRVNKNMLTPTVKALDFLKMLDESNEALQAENTRLRGELDAARGAHSVAVQLQTIADKNYQNIMDDNEVVNFRDYQTTICNLRETIAQLKSEMHEVAYSLSCGLGALEAAKRLRDALNGEAQSEQ